MLGCQKCDLQESAARAQPDVSNKGGPAEAVAKLFRRALPAGREMPSCPICQGLRCPDDLKLFLLSSDFLEDRPADYAVDTDSRDTALLRAFPVFSPR